MMEVPEQLSQRVQSKVVRDISPSLWTVSWKSGSSVVFGGFISLLLCGQFGVSITHAAEHINQRVHAHSHDYVQALLFGIVFSLIPPFILRLLCSPLQYRVVTRKPLVAFAWIIGLGAALAHHGHVTVEIIGFAFWAAASVATFKVLTQVIDRSASHLVLPWGSEGH